MDRPSSYLNRHLPTFLFFSLFVIFFLSFSESVHGAVRITSISPSCAQPGDHVVLSGNGFGAHNVRIAINTVPATVLRATGNRATFVVPSGILPGVATVMATNPGGQSGTIALRIKSATEVCGNQIDDNCDGVVDDPAVCTAVNRRPIANAGPDITVPVGSTVSLDGTASSDPDGNSLTFQWSLIIRPTASIAGLEGATTALPTLTIDQPGAYHIQLVVNDGELSSTADLVIVSTINSAPVADAGPSQTGTVGTTVTFDGSGSSDVDGDVLIYQWSLRSAPAGSTATVVDPTAINPRLTIDKAGTYTVQLVVSDGIATSDPDATQVDTLNSPPVANAGPDQSARVGETVTLDGGNSHDADANPLIYQWSLVTQPTDSTTVLQNPTTPQPTFTIDKAGTYVAQLIVNDGIVNGEPDSVTVSTLNSKPVAEAGPDQDVFVGQLVDLDGSGSTDADDDPLSYFWSIASRPEGSNATVSNEDLAHPTFTPDTVGTYVLQLIVNDGTVDSDPDTITITVPDTIPPPPANLGTITQSPVTTGQVTLTGSVNSVEGNAQVTVTNTRTNQSVTVTATVEGSFTLQIGAQNGDTLSILVTDGAGNTSPPGTLTVEPPLPPDPATVAPAINRTVSTTVADSTVFLYTGPTPIQTGVAAGTIEAKRAAVLRGTVRTKDSSPLSGVTIAILQHPEFGQTLSRADGRFDLAVNGGGLLTVTYAKVGYLSAQRSVQTPWQEYAGLPDVVLIPLDSQVTTIDLTNPVPMQVARGSVVTDSDGARQATLLFPQGTQAQMLLPNGTTQPLATLHVRATEYTVGTTGPAAMPADLPSTSVYTYAVELSVDEAIANGKKLNGKDVLFSQPVRLYVENFLGFPIGEVAPLGYYDNDRGVWIPADSGRVIKILSITNNAADVDTNGDAVVDDVSTLNALGISDAERQQLAALYAPGQSLWRVTMTHFSTWDINWGIAPPDFSGAPFWSGGPRPGGGPSPTGNTTGGSTGGSTNGSGTTSGGTSGGSTSGGTSGGSTGGGTTGGGTSGGGTGGGTTGGGTTGGNTGGGNTNGGGTTGGTTSGTPLEPLIGPGGGSNNEGPDGVAKPNGQCGSIIHCQNQALGEVLPISGTGMHLVYKSERTRGRTNAYTVQIPLNEGAIPGTPQRVEIEVTIAGQKVTQSYPPVANQWVRFTWDGRDGYGRPMQGAQPIRVRVGNTYEAVYARTSRFGYSGNGTAITGSRARQEVTLWKEWQGHVGGWDAKGQELGGWSLSHHHAYDPIGQTFYGGDGTRRTTAQIRSGEITTYAGSARTGGDPGDGGPATNAWLIAPTNLAFDATGTVYFTDQSQRVVRKISPTGIISRVAGTFGGSGTTPATQFPLDTPWGITVDRDGSVYVSDSGRHRVYKVTPQGAIASVVGTGIAGFSGDGGPASNAQLHNPRGLALDSDGNLYIADINNLRVRKVSPDGAITTVAGNGQIFGTYTGTRSALQVSVAVRGVVVDRFGNLLVSDAANDVIHKVTPTGRISVFAGVHGVNCGGCGGPFNGESGLATQVYLGDPEGLAVGSDGSVYIGDVANRRLRKVTPDGMLMTIAGTGSTAFLGDNGPASAASIGGTDGIAVGPEGNIYLTGSQRVRRIAKALPNFTDTDILLASEDGSEVYRFDRVGRHLQTLDTLTNTAQAQFAYDGAGRLRTITDANNNVATIERAADGAPTAILTPFGQRTALSVDSNGYLASLTSPAGDTHQLTTTGTGLLTSMTTPRNGGYQFAYDDFGRLVSDTDPAGGRKTLSRTETATGYVVAVQSAEGRTNRYPVTDAANGALQRSTVAPDGTLTARNIESSGRTVATQRDGTLVTQRLGPDPRFGLRVPVATERLVTTPGGLVATATQTRTTTLSDPNNPLSLTSQVDTRTVNGRVYTSTYTQASRTLVRTTPTNRQTTTTLDTQGRVSSIQLPELASTQVGYDARGRVTQVGQGGRNTTMAYDANGYPATATDALGRTTSFTRDAVGRPLTQTLPDGRVIAYTYDASGNLTSLTPPSRPAHSFTYTPVELPLTSLSPPVTGGGTNTTSYAYNRDRQVTSVTRADGQQILLTYDGAGRVSSQTLPTGTFGVGYDSAGRLQSRSAPSGANLTYGYDGGLLTTVTATGPVPGNITWTYDHNFRATSQSVTGSSSIPFTYDADSLLTGAGTLTLSRHAQNGLLTGTTLGTVSDTLSYNTFAEPTDYQASVSGASLFRQQYTRDTGGRLAQKTETINGTTTTYSYTYDPAGRLTEVKQNGLTVSTYTYDGNGNRLSHVVPAGTQTGTYDPQDRLLTYNGHTYSYTANGELATKASTSTSTTYTYDVLGNLLTVTQPDGTVIDYVIDGAQRRVGKKVNGTLVQGFLYQGQLQPVAELDGNGAIVSRFVYASKANVPDYMLKGGVTYRIISDHLGSPRLVVDITTGAVLQHIDYDEFGQVISDTNPGFQPFGFAGGLYDRDTKLVRFGARDYDAEVGRWTTKDPISFAGGDTNLYGYVLNDPVNLVDPWGLDWLDAVQTTLDVAGLAPGLGEPADLLNAAISAARGDYAGAMLSCAAAIPGVGNFATGAKFAEKGTLVIGRRKDLAKPGAIGEGEYILSWPSKYPDSKAEWAENSGRLRGAMNSGHPIRDVSFGNNDGFFLNAERNLLRSRGWDFNEATGYWTPLL